MAYVHGKLIPGHGIASGVSKDPRFPNGSLEMQIPYFKKLGLDLGAYFAGTLNIDIAPCGYTAIEPAYHFSQIQWTPLLPPENFYFFDATLIHQGNKHVGLIYMPDPETKKEHFQKETVLELIMPHISDLGLGAKVILNTKDSAMSFTSC